MWPFNTRKKVKNKPLKTISIQATEGNTNSIIIESMLTGRRLNMSIPGTTNAFTTYESQVAETYNKYNGLSDFGNQQVRTIVDLRTGFIAGEGISVSAENESTSEWIEKFIKQNKLNGLNFINAVKGTELAGQSIYTLKPTLNDKNEIEIKLFRIAYSNKNKYKPIYKDPLIKDEVIDIQIKTEFGWQSLNLATFIYTRTGGDDSNSCGPVTKIGVVLTDVENYDRAIKDMRRNNHIFARITPVFETTNDAETASLKASLNQMKWKIGEAFIGKAKFRYETPKSGAHDNLTKEMVATIKTISAVTGAPVHWLGYVDLMSNRATANSLYENIKNATSSERTIWEESLYETIFKAQKMYIDNGGTDLNLDPDFQVRLPLISFEDFFENVKALSLAYSDEAISIADYRNAIPGIDPLKTKKAVEAQREEDKKDLMDNNIPNINDEELNNE